MENFIETNAGDANGEILNDEVFNTIISNFIEAMDDDPEFILRCCNYVLHLENGQIQESYSIEDSDGRKRLLKFFLSDMKKEVSTE